jgi:hypothetical protein
MSEAENLLKIKDQSRAFLENEAENILKTKPLTRIHRNLK